MTARVVICEHLLIGTRLLCRGEPLNGLLDEDAIEEFVRQGRAMRVPEPRIEEST